MLIDDIMPEYQIKKKYSILIRAPKEKVFTIMTGSASVTDSPVVRFLIRLRELPSRLLGRGERIFPQEPLKLSDFLQRSPFALLGKKENEELVLGIVGRFWDVTNTKMKKMSGVEEFKAFHEAGFGKGAMNFYLESLGGGTRLSTETRVLFSAGYLGMFKRYWFFVEPFSGLTRKIFLKNIKRATEKSG